MSIGNDKFEGIYIDQIYIDTNSGNAYTGLSESNTMLGINGVVDHYSGITKTTGYKWVIQITNGTTAQIDFSNEELTLNVCTNYKDENADGESADTYYTRSSGTLDSNASFYIGFISLYSGVDTDIDVYLSDQIDSSDNIVVSSRFILKLEDSAPSIKDVVGNSNFSNPFNPLTFTFDQSIVLHTITQCVGTGSAKRDNNDNLADGSVVPTRTFNIGDWNFQDNSIESYFNATAYGDPHICTLFGEHYEFDYFGYIRLFDNQHIREGKDNDLIIINGEVQAGPGRWSGSQYIRKLFIYNAGKTMLVDLGFRGSKVTIEQNDGIEYEEEELSFDKDAMRYCFDCIPPKRFKTKDSNVSCNNNHNHNLPPLVRNKISFDLCGSEEDTKSNKVELHVILENVNEYNLQPCRLNIAVGNDGINKKKASGCIVNRKYATHCALKSICNIDDLPEPTEEEMKNIPELEIKPILRNLKWK